FRADADVEQVEFRRTGMGMMRKADYRASIDPPCVEAWRCGKSVGRLLESDLNRYGMSGTQRGGERLGVEYGHSRPATSVSIRHSRAAGAGIQIRDSASDGALSNAIAKPLAASSRGSASRSWSSRCSCTSKRTTNAQLTGLSNSTRRRSRQSGSPLLGRS